MAGGAFDPDAESAWDEGKETRRLVETFVALVDRLRAIAADELAGRPISGDDNEWLSWIGARMQGFTEELLDYELEPSPLVADIFLDPFADEVLEVATGPLDTIHVLVPDDDGRFHVATGAVSSYYEFWGPRAERLTDEEWWDRIVSDQLPDRPAWWLEQHG